MKLYRMPKNKWTHIGTDNAIASNGSRLHRNQWYSSTYSAEWRVLVWKTFLKLKKENWQKSEKLHRYLELVMKAWFLISFQYFNEVKMIHPCLFTIPKINYSISNTVKWASILQISWNETHATLRSLIFGLLTVCVALLGIYRTLT